MLTSSSIRKLTLAIVLGALGTVSLRGEIVTGTFTGDGGWSKGFLFDPEKWSGHEVPGVCTYKDEDGNTVTNGDFGGTMIFSQTGGAGGILYTAMSSGGAVTNLLSTYKIILRGEIPQFTTYQYQTLAIEAGGGIYAEEDCAYPLVFSGGNSILAMRETTPDNRTLHLYNDSKNPLILNRNGITYGAVGYCDNSGLYSRSSDYPPILSHEGSGEIQWGYSGYTSGSGGIPVYEIRQTGSGKTVFCSTSSIHVKNIVVYPSETVRTVLFNTGSDGKPHDVYFRSNSDQFIIMSDTEISGLSAAVFSWYNSTPGFFCISNGVTCTFKAVLKNYNNNSSGASYKWTYNGTSMNELLPFGVRGGGKLVLVHNVTSNEVKGAAWITEGSVLETSYIGKKGKSSPLGVGDRIWFSSGGRMVYTGAGETTDRTLCHMEQGGVFENYADGNLFIESICGSGSAASTMILSNLVQNALVITGAITNRTASQSTKVVKAGAGPVRFEGTVGANCAVTVEEGTLTLSTTADVGSEISLAEGTKLTVTGTGAKVGSISVVGGEATVNVPDDATITVASFPNNCAGTLNVVLGTGAALKVPGLSGLAPVWIKINGKAAAFDGEGNIKELEITGHVDAHGGVIPNNAAGAVVIDTAIGPKDQNVTLESATTEVAYLQQLQSFDPAIVEFPAGYAFWTSLLSVAEGAKSLTLGQVAGQGTFNARGDVLQLETSGTDGGITIYPAFNISKSATIVKTGEGDVIFEGGFNGCNMELTGPFSYENSSTENDAYFRIESENNAPYKLHYHGAMTTADPGALTVYGGTFKMTGDGVGRVGNIVLEGDNDFTWSGPHLMCSYYAPKKENPTTNTWTFGSGGCSIVRFTDGAYTGRLQVAVGDAWSSSAAIYQSGGEIFNMLTTEEDAYTESIGMRGYAYYLMTGGKSVVAGRWVTAGTYGDMVMEMRAGTNIFTKTSVRESGFAHSHNNSHAVLHITGTGNFDGSGIADYAYLPEEAAMNADAVITVANGGYLTFAKKYTYVGVGKGDRYTPVNININEGGTLKASSFVRDKSYSAAYAKDLQYTNAWPTVNFNGGTLECGENSMYIFGRNTADWFYPPERVVSYEKGAIISRAVAEGTTKPDKVYDILGPGGGIVAPEGKGVFAVELDDVVRNTTFIGSPVVTVEGDGKGSSIFAEFDETTGKVTNMTVTCHGENYTWAQACVYLNGSIITRLPATLKDNVSGGLTKIGAGALRVSCANTYTGVTCVREGTLQVMNDGSLSEQSRLRLEGGTLKCESKKQLELADFDYVSGTVDATLLPIITGIVVDMDEVVEGHLKYVCTESPDGSPLVTYSSEHPPVTLINVDSSKLTSNNYSLVEFADLEFATKIDTSATNVPPGWRLGLSDNILRMTRDRGMIIMLRKHKTDL